MKTQNMLSVFFMLSVLLSCNSSKPKIDSETYSFYQKKGNEITTLAQATLLSNVGKAMKTGGPEYAVEFCNLKASSIIDSLNHLNQCIISRVSAKNRNPENNLKTDLDKELWPIFESETKIDTLIQTKEELVYYKSINIGMAACLKCHGEFGSDINSATAEKIGKLYPADLATGYKLNDFRGLWKVEFTDF